MLLPEEAIEEGFRHPISRVLQLLLAIYCGALAATQLGVWKQARTE